MKGFAMLSLAVALTMGAPVALAQPAGQPGAAAPANAYTLPDPLVTKDGRRITTPALWWKSRRPEILAMIEQTQFGRSPPRPKDLWFEVFDKGTPAYEGKALRKQVTIHLGKQKDAPVIDLVFYTPAHAKKPVPMILQLAGSAVEGMFDDPGIRRGLMWNNQTKTLGPVNSSILGLGHGKSPLPHLIDAGIGVGAIYMGQYDPDFWEGYPKGVRAWYATGAAHTDQNARDPAAWGAIASWGWGLSRALDYLETDRRVDAKRVAISGDSRRGKAVLWAAARDQRFAAVISCCSGKGGAAISRRTAVGETVGAAYDRGPYFYAANFGSASRKPEDLPFDGHMLVALIAPRPVMVQTGVSDTNADPEGQFLGLVGADPVYRLLGSEGLSGQTAWPSKGGSMILHDLSYYIHNGGHGIAPEDWDAAYIPFLKRSLKP